MATQATDRCRPNARLRLSVSILSVALVALASAIAVVGQAPQSDPRADFVLPGERAHLPAPLGAALDRLSPERIGVHITTLASPGYGGRGLGQPGLDAAAEYVASFLATHGLHPLPAVPGGPGTPATYFHDVPTREITATASELLVTVQRGAYIASRSFAAGVDCVFQERAPSVVSGPLVFAGYGIRESSPARDDYAGLTVTDSTVVVFGGLPDDGSFRTPALVAKYEDEDGAGRHQAKADIAQALGARALLVIENASFPRVVAAGSDSPAARYFVPYDFGAEQDGTIPIVRVSPAVGAMVFSGAGLTLPAARIAAPRPLPAVSATIRSTATERLVMSQNVIATIPGTDPVLKHRAVIIGAHLDHLGQTSSGLYPGADDNASGTAAVLEIAATFAASTPAPKRTVIFVWWTGEEEGHLGSEYYALHPVWPIDRTDAYLNLDMIAHPWKAEEIAQLVKDSKLNRGADLLLAMDPANFLEVGVPPTAPDLDPVLASVARGTGVALHFDRTDGRRGGSDYRAFARLGRPFVRFFGNYFPGYHQPTDVAADIDVKQVSRVATLAFGTTWLLANR